MTKFQIIRDILALDNVTAQEKLVLIAMNQFGDGGRNIYPAISTISALASLSPRQTRRHIKVLRRKGYLKPQGTARNHAIRYSLGVPTKVTPGVSPARHQRPTPTLNDIPSINPPLSGDYNIDNQTGGGFRPELNPAGRETMELLGVRKPRRDGER